MSRLPGLNLNTLPTIPDGWIWCRLGDLVWAIETGRSFRCEERPPREGETGVLKVSAVTWGEFNEFESKTCTEPERVAEQFLVRPGDFLFSRANTIELVGACVIVHSVASKVMLSDKTLRFKMHGVEDKWLLYVLRSPWGRGEIERLSTGNQHSMRNIGQDRIRAIRIPLPPLAEQRRIVAEIEKQFTTLDAAVCSLTQTREKTRKLSERFLNEQFNSLSCPWVELGAICRVVRGASPRPAGSPRFFGGSIPWITVGSLTGSKGPYLRETSETLTEEGRNHSRYVEPETLLLTNSGATLGVPRITKIGGCINDGSVALLELDEAAKLFLYYFLSTQTKKLRRINQGAAQPNLNTSLVKAIRVPNPDPNLKLQTVERLECTLPAFDAIDSTTEAITARAARLRQSILARALSGQLVPQDPNDEPASILLERIRAQRGTTSKRAVRRKRVDAQEELTLQS